MAWSWETTYWSSFSLISFGVGRSSNFRGVREPRDGAGGAAWGAEMPGAASPGRAPVRGAPRFNSSRRMELQSSSHSLLM